jgi:hypothetical protein
MSAIYAKNCPLTLHADLDGVDPFDPYLTKEIRQKIIEEVKVNILYYFALFQKYIEYESKPIFTLEDLDKIKDKEPILLLSAGKE